jgi:SAM-dependent methyltransferase
MKCRISGEEMYDLFTLGNLYISDFIKTESDYRGIDKPELRVQLSKETKCIQLAENADKHFMYGKYWYHSGTNNTMRRELNDIAKSAMELSKIKMHDKLYNPSTLKYNLNVFLDIASNDGTLLSFVDPTKYTRIGIDPAEGIFQKEAAKNCDIAVQDFFTKEVYKKTTSSKANIVTCIAMFYDLDDPITFLKDVYEVMEDDGLFIIQQSYMPLMIKQLAFDNICHEHVFYHSLYSMEYMLKKAGFKIVDVQLNDVNGGSFRTYIQKEKAAINSFGSSPYRDVAQMRIESLREYEKTLKLDEPEFYMTFWEDILKLKDQTFEFIKKVKNEGKSVWVYGASTKGNTLLQWFGLDNKFIDGAAERSPYKYGLKTIGTNIPIHSDETMRQVHPDYLLILPWHFINEFKYRETAYLEKGGHFIIPCPKFEII